MEIFKEHLSPEVLEKYGEAHPHQQTPPPDHAPGDADVAANQPPPATSEATPPKQQVSSYAEAAAKKPEATGDTPPPAEATPSEQPSEKVAAGN